jgi:CarD family transcriptional regulator
MAPVKKSPAPARKPAPSAPRAGTRVSTPPPPKPGGKRVAAKAPALGAVAKATVTGKAVTRGAAAKAGPKAAPAKAPRAAAPVAKALPVVTAGKRQKPAKVVAKAPIKPVKPVKAPAKPVKPAEVVKPAAKAPKPAKPARPPKAPRPPKPVSPFNVGDKVVYPHHGAAVIVRKEKGRHRDQRIDYFVLEVAADQLTLKVPVSRAVDLGVRPVISKAVARKVFATFKEPPEEAGANWSRWYKLLTEKINSGDIFQVAEVVRDLTSAQHAKGISPALKRMLSKARLILASELRFALDVSEEEAMRRLDKALPKVDVVEEF